MRTLSQIRADRLGELRALRLEAERRRTEAAAAAERRAAAEMANVDVFAAIGYQPHPKQSEFHEATEFDVLYGGSAGGGKSYAITAEGIRAAVRYAGLRVLLVRRTYDELNESIFPALRKFNYGAAVGGKFNHTERELRFPNGSLIRFRYLETLDDASRRQGGEYQLLLVDEATLMPPGVVDILRFERLRAAGDTPVIGVRSTTNPGGPSHGQVKTRYIDATDRGQHVAVDEHGNQIRFIQARSSDNPHLDSGYQGRLDSIPDPQRRAAMRDGDWDVFAGQMFGEWRHDRHTLDPIELPAEWGRDNGIDWGFTNPWAVLWGAVDEDDRIWIYRELYDTQVGEADQARRILAAEETDGDSVRARYADDAMWATRGDAKPIADVYSDNGVYLTPAGKGPGSRIAGWQRIHSYLAEAPACPHHRALGWPSCPRLHVFRTCPDLIRTLPMLPHATTGNPEDADTKAEDHLPDALRYLLLNVGNDAHWIFPPDPDQPITPEHAVNRAPVTPAETIGGFPILNGSDPWSTFG